MGETSHRKQIPTKSQSNLNYPPAMGLHYVVLHKNDQGNGEGSVKLIMIKGFTLSNHFKIWKCQPIEMRITNWNLQKTKDLSSNTY